MRKLVAMVATGMIVLLGLMMTGCTAFPEKKHQDWSNVTRSERLNELFWGDVAAKRWEQVQRHVAPLAVFNEGEKTTSGVSEIMAQLKNSGIGSVQVGDVTSQPAGADLVTTYTLSIDGRPAMRAMTVWQAAGGHMVIVAHSSSPAAK